MARTPFKGDVQPTHVPTFRRTPHGFPFPHFWNYREPLGILDAVYWGAEKETGSGRHNRYLKGFGMVGLATREPAVIKAILLATGDKAGQFDRDTWPTKGIARATGANTLLYSNGPRWRRQKKLVAPSFSATTLFRPEVFHEFEQMFRKTVGQRLDAFGARHRSVHPDGVEIDLETEISAVMLEMLVNKFFGASVPYDEIRGRYIPSIQALIARMVRDALGFRFLALEDRRQVRRWRADFEELTQAAIDGRKTGRGAWGQFASDLPDDALRPNVRVFLAGALEATTSLAAWTMSHLARRPDLQARIFEEVRDLDVYDPENLAQCPWLGDAIQETLRLTPALYFLPRVATADTWVTLDDGRKLMVPKGTHVVLDVWNANRCEEFWGMAATGFAADAYEPERWRRLRDSGKNPADWLHFGFGHGARVCPGKFLGTLEVGLVVGGLVKLFEVWATQEPAKPMAGVSTKPADRTRVHLRRRDP